MDARERDCLRDRDLECVEALSLGFVFDFRLGAMAAAYATIQAIPHCGNLVPRRIVNVARQHAPRPRKVINAT
jgi:hypothetical protein